MCRTSILLISVVIRRIAFYNTFDIAFYNIKYIFSIYLNNTFLSSLCIGKPSNYRYRDVNE
jgi:hypothetical protein